MADDGYIINRSNYTIKSFNGNVRGGTVYERDFMAARNLGGWAGASFPHEEGNFKMVYRNDKQFMRNHNFGKYLTTVGGSEVWTMADCNVNTSEIDGKRNGYNSTESHLHIKSDDTTLLSYAYYGSCNALIQSTITDILKKFPAEMFTTTTEESVEDIGGSGWYELLNPFNIDIVTKYTEGDEIELPVLRYMSLSYQRYTVGARDRSADYGCISQWSVRTKRACTREDWSYDKEVTIACGDSVSFIIRRYYRNNMAVYYMKGMGASASGVYIRPSADDFEQFFNNIDDFEHLLLNRDSDPIYTAMLDFPHETENGFETYQKSYTWPVDGDGWNLDIESPEYGKYISDLLHLADFYDEYYTDNLWRMMTHDSIKNMDITFQRPLKDEGTEDYNDGTTKMRGLMWAYGRQFDEIKRIIDGIRSVNLITYNGEGNVPDYLLSDSLNLSGWEVSSAVSGLSITNTVSNLFEGYSKTYDVAVANIEFLKNLKLNSHSIFSRKGTRNGIECILGLFGYRSDDFMGEGKGDYSMTEYTRYITYKDGNYHTSADGTLTVETYEGYRTNTETSIPDIYGYDRLAGLPVILYYYKKDGVEKKTIIPWFKTEMDGEPYFQMYGGWGKINDGKYSESINYVKVVTRISDLRKIDYTTLYSKKPGSEVAYVIDVSNFSDYFSDGAPTHYFRLNNAADIDKIGSTGWVPEYNTTEMAEIVDEYRGNNPHVGYGQYDDGEEFYKYFEQIFKGAIDGNLFNDIAYDCESGNLNSGILNCGFDVHEQEDNKKVHYFYDKNTYKLNSLKREVRERYETDIPEDNEEVLYTAGSIGEDEKIPYIQYKDVVEYIGDVAMEHRCTMTIPDSVKYISVDENNVFHTDGTGLTINVDVQIKLDDIYVLVHPTGQMGVKGDPGVLTLNGATSGECWETVAPVAIFEDGYKAHRYGIIIRDGFRFSNDLMEKFIVAPEARQWSWGIKLDMVFTLLGTKSGNPPYPPYYPSGDTEVIGDAIYLSQQYIGERSGDAPYYGTNVAEGGDLNTVDAEPSIINDKRLVIDFRCHDQMERDYITNTVTPYLMQMVPSTTILKINTTLNA